MCFKDFAGKELSESSHSLSTITKLIGGSLYLCSKRKGTHLKTKHIDQANETMILLFMVHNCLSALRTFSPFSTMLVTLFTQKHFKNNINNNFEIRNMR